MSESIISPPEETREGDIDERGATTLGHDHVLPDGLGEPIHVADLVKGGEQRHVGHCEEGGVGIAHAFGSVQEVEFPGNRIFLYTSRQ